MPEEIASAGQEGGGPQPAPKQERISARATGLSVFAAKIISIPTGLLFITLIIRTLSTAQFGLWEVIATVLAFSLYPSNLINFWTTRDSARGKAVGATALVSNLILSLLGVAIFLGIAVVTYGRISASFFPFLVASVLVPVGYWYNTASAILNGARPQKFGYVLVAGEVAKLGSAFFVLYILRTGLIGVIFALGVANLIQGALSTFYVKTMLSGGLELSVAVRWLKDAWIPSLNIVFSLLSIADTLVASVAFGSTIIAGDYQSAYLVAAIVSYSFYLSYALYPLLLRGAKDKLVATLLDYSLMLGIPMAIGASVLAPQILFVFGEKYVAYSTALSILAFASLANALSSFFDSSLMGKETADLVNERKFSRYIKSDLFFVNAVDLGYAIAYIPSVFLVVWLGTRSSLSIQVLVEAWAAVQLAYYSAIIIIKLRRLGTNSLRGIGRPLALYSTFSLLMGLVVYVLSPFFVATSFDALVYALRLLVLVGLSGCLYFGLLFVFDVRSRANLRRVLRAVFRRGSQPEESPSLGAPTSDAV